MQRIQVYVTRKTRTNLFRLSITVFLFEVTLTPTTYTMTDQRDQIRSALANCIQDYATQTGVVIAFADDARLLGSDAPLDSLGLVTVLAGFEAAVNDAFGTDIVLADERAMSLERSPFRTVSSLIDYTCILLDEARNGCAS
jgi:hypothetical protein